MKSLLMIFALVTATQFASAATSSLYDCGVPQDSSGRIKMGGSSFQVDFKTDGTVFLITSNYDTGKLRQSTAEMKKSFQGVDGASYSLDSVQVNIFNNLVTLIEGKDFTATCGKAKPQSNPVLIQVVQSSGAEASKRTLQLFQNGSVVETLGSALQSPGQPSEIQIAQLSASAMARLNSLISQIELNKKPVDPNPGGLNCHNTMTETVSLIQAKGPVTLSLSQQCHTSTLEGSEDVVNLALSLMNLGQ